MVPGAAPGMVLPASMPQASIAVPSSSGAPAAMTTPRPLFPAAAAQVR